jgi:hypothetical protein
MTSTRRDEGMGFALVDGGVLWDSFLFHIVPVAIPQGRISVSFCVPILNFVVVVVVDTSTSGIYFLKRPGLNSCGMLVFTELSSRMECLGCFTTACSLKPFRPYLRYLIRAVGTHLQLSSMMCPLPLHPPYLLPSQIHSLQPQLQTMRTFQPISPDQRKKKKNPSITSFIGEPLDG